MILLLYKTEINDEREVRKSKRKEIKSGSSKCKGEKRGKCFLILSQVQL